MYALLAVNSAGFAGLVVVATCHSIGTSPSTGVLNLMVWEPKSVGMGEVCY